MEEIEVNKREVRSYIGGKFQPHFREVPDEEGGGRIIEGYAIVFDVQSRLLSDYWENYYEIIESGAITEESLREMDIKMTIWHNREKLLARSNKGVGTLKLTVDEIGVKYEFEAPDTADGNNAWVLTKRGDLSGSSFSYWSDERSSVRYTTDENDILVRHVERIDKIFEMTIASDPAYTETNVTAREIEMTGFKLPDKKGEEAARQASELISREKNIARVRKAARSRFF